MCGIVGYYGLGAQTGKPLIEKMLQRIVHRGPDDTGYFISERSAIGMQRLSIIDLSTGKQPISNKDGTLQIILNGEIYNYQELRSNLQAKGYSFKTKSDTETILHLYEEYGSKCVDYLRGMFAFAILDERKKTMFIARDRLGVKPLYYMQINGAFLFASEIKSLLEYEGYQREICFTAVDQFLTLRYVPGPRTLFKGIFKFPAATFAIVENGEAHFQEYWQPYGHENQKYSDQGYLDRFSQLFEESVKYRMISDVPVGAFLSGGLDSTAITAAMSGMTSKKVQAFSVGFDWEGDELPAAQQTAHILGLDLHKVICQEKDFLDLPKMIWHLDEPIGDAIIVPFYLLAKEAKKHVKVVLTGEGADEFLGGYLMTKMMMKAKSYQNNMPSFLKSLAVSVAKLMPLSILNMVFDYSDGLGPKGRMRLAELLNHLKTNSKSDDIFNHIVSLFSGWERQSAYSEKFKQILRSDKISDKSNAIPDSYGLKEMNDSYRQHWLPDLILTKQDKITMANSIEGRVPFLDHKLIEFVTTMPDHLKLAHKKDKIALRHYLDKKLGGEYSKIKKKAFYIPIDKYMKDGPLTQLKNDLIKDKNSFVGSLFQKGYLDDLDKKIGTGEFLYGKQMFGLLTLELWHKIFIQQEKGWS